MTIMRITRLITVIALGIATRQAVAQSRPDTAATRRGAPAQGRVQASSQGLTSNRDVILEVPELSVDSIGLTVSDVKAHVSLDANAMNLVQLSAGVDVGIKKVQLGIVGVYGEVYLYADLDNVARIVDRVVATLDRNPRILTQVLAAVDTTVNAALPRRR
jgi:hypothetical protein